MEPFTFDPTLPWSNGIKHDTEGAALAVSQHTPPPAYAPRSLQVSGGIYINQLPQLDSLQDGHHHFDELHLQDEHHHQDKHLHQAEHRQDAIADPAPNVTSK